METMSAAARWTLITSVIAGVSYVTTWGLSLPTPMETVWKGAGVALLAVHAAIRARSLDGWLLVTVMAFGAGGDVLLETHGLTVGAVSFLLGHLVATGLYLRHRGPRLAAQLALIPVVAVTAYLLPSDRANAPGIAIYSLFLAIMATTALMSRFQRRLVGLGALMFVLSDLLIFARLGTMPDNLATGLAVWGLYYFGQVLICIGVIKGLNVPIADFPGESRGPDRTP